MSFKELFKQMKAEKDKKLQEKIEKSDDEELKEFSKLKYKTHLQLILAGVICLIIGVFISPLLLVSAIFFVLGFIWMGTHWEQIKEEYDSKRHINRKF